MKFIHVSDIHIGITPEPTMPWSNDRALDIKETFSNVINKCKEEDAELLLISGDLFNHQPLTDDLDFVNELFKSIYDTKVLIVAGSNDYIRSSSPILNYKFSENVYVFLNQLPEEVEIKGTKIVVHGFSYFSQEETHSFVNSIRLNEDKKIHILLAYGGDNRHCPIDFDLLNKKPFTYCALGSNHKAQVITENKIAYAGSLEPLSSNETGVHGIFIGEINQSTRRLTTLRFEKMAKLSYVPINIKINANVTEDELIDLVNGEINKHGKENIYKLEINGLRNPEIEFSKDIFDKNIKLSSFVDYTEPRYDFVKLSDEHPKDMIGAYIRNFLSTKRELSDIEKNALYHGVHALIKTSEKSED